MTTAMLNRVSERLQRIKGVPVLDLPGSGETMAEEPAERPASKPDFAALERLPGYWRGRANGRQAAVDFRRGEACQRAETAAVDTSHDLLRDHAMIAEYEKRAEEVRS